MTLHVQSARINYSGPGRLDCTRKSGTEGLFLAPSWAILRPALDGRREAERLQREGADVRAADVERSIWADYVPPISTRCAGATSTTARSGPPFSLASAWSYAAIARTRYTATVPFCGGAYCRRWVLWMRERCQRCAA